MLRRPGTLLLWQSGHEEATKKGAKYKKFDVERPTGPLTLYAGPKVLSALQEVMQDMTLYHGVRLSEVMKAVYEQGQKDGRREIIEEFEGIKKQANYLPPGRPRKARKRR